MSRPATPHGRWIPAALLCLLLLPGLRAAEPAYPASRVDDPREVLHGVPVADPYRWLEDGTSAEVRAWTEQQNRFTRERLRNLPARAALEKRLAQLLDLGTLGAAVPRGATLFYTRREGAQNQAVLIARTGERVATLLDPNELNPAGTTAIDWFFPSRDGGRVAVGLSENGTEQSTLRILTTRKGLDEVAETIPHTRACSLAWLPDGSGFYYTRYPSPGTVPAGQERYFRRVYLHRLGQDPAQDSLAFGERLEPADWPNVAISPDGRWLVVEVEQGWAKNQVWLLDRETKGATWTPLVAEGDALYRVVPQRGVLYVRTDAGAPRGRVFAVDPLNPQRPKWREVIPQQADVLDGLGFAGGRLVASYLRDATSRLRVYSPQGTLEREVALPTLGSLTGMAGEGDREALTFGFHSFTLPPAIYRVDLSAKDAAPESVVAIRNPIRSEEYEVRQVRYPSRDGTPVTMFLAGKKGLPRDGTTPTLLWAYGGFNISVTPNFQAHRLAFLERGGLLAIPNLRGGGEYGEAWHKGGMLANKQNVFDDYIAAADYLIREKYTSPQYLCGEGRSNGGLLMGAALTQAPDRFRAIVCGVPLLDMVRYPRFLIAKLWIPEYGDPAVREEFGWLHAYSPYHRVKEGVRYPATLITTAESDTRVDPLHARKMAARLQAVAKGADAPPILLRVETGAGHGVGKPRGKQLDELVDTWSFVFDQLGLK